MNVGVDSTPYFLEAPYTNTPKHQHTHTHIQCSKIQGISYYTATHPTSVSVHSEKHYRAMLFTQPREGRRYLLARGTPGSSKNKHSLISAPLQLLPKRISGKRRKVLFREHQSYQAAEKLATTSLSPAATSSFWKSASVTISFTFPAAPFLFLDLLAMTVPVAPTTQTRKLLLQCPIAHAPTFRGLYKRSCSCREP